VNRVGFRRLVAAVQAGSDATVEHATRLGQKLGETGGGFAQCARDIQPCPLGGGGDRARTATHAECLRQLFHELIQFELKRLCPIEVVQRKGVVDLGPQGFDAMAILGPRRCVEDLTGTAELPSIDTAFSVDAFDAVHQVEHVALDARIAQQLREIAEPLGVGKPHPCGAARGHPPATLPAEARLARRRGACSPAAGYAKSVQERQVIGRQHDVESSKDGDRRSCLDERALSLTRLLV
jgi:hypothetical protein